MRRWIATGDFETRSALNLKKVGAWKYSRHASTDALCFGYAIDREPRRMWRRGDKPPRDLFAALESGCFLEAHNAFFEWCIWHNVMVPKYGWPPLEVGRIVCSAARAAVACLPRALEFAVIHAGLDVRKGDDKAMKKLSSPRKATKKDSRVWWDEDDAPDLYQELYEYCDLDVQAEQALSDHLRALSPFERRVFLADLRINLRGVLVDREFINCALAVNRHIDYEISSELTGLTRGDVMAATERDRILAYLEEIGLELPSLTAEVVEDTLYHSKLTKTQRRILQLRQEGARSSVNKYQAFDSWTDQDDDVLRGLYIYYGANAHGRWSARGVQPQNFPRGNAKPVSGEKGGVAIALMVATIKEAALFNNLDLLRERFVIKEHKVPGDPKSGTKTLPAPPSEVLSTALRGAFVARPGKHFGVGDYSAIEARVLFWLAEERYGLSVYENDGDIYRDMGSVIFGKPPEELDVDFERMLGKTTVLGCGYGMGWKKFKLTCKRAYGMVISDTLCKKSVYAYRDRYEAVPDFWEALEKAARRAIRSGLPQYVSQKRIMFSMRRGDLVITLPSGREIFHRRARISRDQIVFVNGKGWNESTYGGKLCEYITSGTARDVLADAVVRAEFDEPDFDPVMHSHDELVGEGEPGEVSKIVERIMGQMPPWTKGLPMKIEVWEGPRYHK